MGKFQYKHYLLVLLTIVATFNYLDRFVLSLVLEPIKQEFQLSDSQIGILTGFAFALFYAVAGIPIARWADKGNRNTIVTLTTALWSCMVALSAVVGNFSQLLLVRIGVAVGEAGCIPPAQSWISDYFGRTERPRANAIYFMAFPLAVIIGYLGGGWLAETIGWRMTFIIIGLPGIFLAILVKFTLPEPRLQQKASVALDVPSMKDVLTTLWRQRSFPHIVMAFVIAYLFGTGIVMWLPSFFIRSHGMGASEVGAWLALTNGFCGVIGTYLGGILMSRYAASKEALQMRAAALAFVAMAALYIVAYLATSKYLALACIGTLIFLSSLTTATIFSAMQSLVAARMRSVAVAVVFLLANLIGAGFGPLLAGVLSDLLRPMFGQESLRYALVLLSPGYLWAAFHYWKASRTIEADIASVELETSSTDLGTVASEPDTTNTSQSTLGFNKP